MKKTVPRGIGNSIKEVVTETGIDKSHNVVMWINGLDVVDMKYCRTEISGGRQAERSAFPWLEFHYIINMYSAIYVYFRNLYYKMPLLDSSNIQSESSFQAFV